MLSRTRNPARLGQQLADAAARTGRYPLLILPSTDAGFQLLAACARRGMPVKVVGHPGLMASWSKAGATDVTTPWPLWVSLKGEENLLCAVAVFEDQLVAIDDSYLRVEVGNQAYMVSPIIIMILMKFSPPSYLGRMSASRRRHACGITLTPYAPDMPAAPSRQMVNEVMGNVLQPLLDCANDVSLPWLARPSFPLKRNNNFYRVLVQQIQEMETLVRLCCVERDESEVPEGWLDVLRASRVEIARHLQ